MKRETTRMLGSTRLGGLLGVVAAVLVLQLSGCADTPVGPVELSPLEVSITVSGVDASAGFLITLDGGAPQATSAGVGLVFRAVVASGKHTVVLSGFPGNCSVDGPNPLVVDVPPSDVAKAEFR